MSWSNHNLFILFRSDYVTYIDHDDVVEVEGYESDDSIDPNYGIQSQSIIKRQRYNVHVLFSIILALF